MKIPLIKRRSLRNPMIQPLSTLGSRQDWRILNGVLAVILVRMIFII